MIIFRESIFNQVSPVLCYLFLLSIYLVFSQNAALDCCLNSICLKGRGNAADRRQKLWLLLQEFWQLLLARASRCYRLDDFYLKIAGAFAEAFNALECCKSFSISNQSLRTNGLPLFSSGNSSSGGGKI